MKSKRYKKKTIGNYISREIMIIVLSIVSSFLIINYFYKCFNKVILPLAESETKRYITQIINESTNDISFSKELFIINKKDDNNEIKMITYNSYEATKLINHVTSNIQNKFDNLFNNNYVITEIPLGVIFNSSLLKNLGPMIKIRLRIIGSVLSELQTEVKPYGINNALVEVKIKLSTTGRIILPVVSKDIEVNNIVPISINIVNGNIPDASIYSYK